MYASDGAFKIKGQSNKESYVSEITKDNAIFVQDAIKSSLGQVSWVNENITSSNGEFTLKAKQGENYPLEIVQDGMAFSELIQNGEYDIKLMEDSSVDKKKLKEYLESKKDELGLTSEDLNKLSQGINGLSHIGKIKVENNNVYIQSIINGQALTIPGDIIQGKYVFTANVKDMSNNVLQDKIILNIVSDDSYEESTSKNITITDNTVIDNALNKAADTIKLSTNK